ncbi:porin [Burkholderia pseudomultivorans]|uniref:Porin n=1 Tax=Burkholderia pseudomultivorans TaxID=1207504 RepID=A0A6P2KKZ9_9BURK|nr:porin [Burkholderia pseudomultivorans]VWB58371.1 porin [Burkholderia pseudomultivorans]
MKKRFAAVCFAVLPVSSAIAQSNITIYGLIDAGVTYVSNEGGHAVAKFDDGILVPNLFVIQGTEDLGGGTKAIFKLEDQFQLGSGATMQPGIFGRNAYVGLDDARFGKLTLGNVYEFMFTSLTEAKNTPGLLSGGLYSVAAGPFQNLGIPQNPTGWFSWARTNGMPINNAVKYQSPQIAGFSVGALYSFGGVAGSFGSNSGISFGLNYDRGPFGFGAAYTEQKYPGAVNGAPQVPIRNWGVGAHYALGPTLNSASFVTVRNAQTGAYAYAGQLASNWQITAALSLGVSYMYMKGNDVLYGNHANQVDAILGYSLSKRTMVYAEGTYQRANSGAHADINGILNPSGSSSGASQAIARVGIRTMF